MDNKIVLRSMKYIDEHLESKITNKQVAQAMGYSEFHFSRLFRSEVQMSLGEYIQYRKLVAAAKFIISGNRIIDGALKYGYETHTGFGKAFYKTFGYPPQLLHGMRLIKSLYEMEGACMKNEKELYEILMNELKNKGYDGIDKCEGAYELAQKNHEGQKRYSGESYMVHVLSVALILIDMEASTDTIVLGLLHDISDVNQSIEKIFGSHISMNLKKLQEITWNGDMLKLDLDESILLVKMADRLHNMKTLEYLDEKRWKIKAQETLEIFAPIAEAMNLDNIKRELEHLSSKYIE